MWKCNNLIVRLKRVFRCKLAEKSSFFDVFVVGLSWFSLLLLPSFENWIREKKKKLLSAKRRKNWSWDGHLFFSSFQRLSEDPDWIFLKFRLAKSLQNQNSGRMYLANFSCISEILGKKLLWAASNARKISRCHFELQRKTRQKHFCPRCDILKRFLKTEVVELDLRRPEASRDAQNLKVVAPRLNLFQTGKELQLLTPPTHKAILKTFYFRKRVWI